MTDIAQLVLADPLANTSANTAANTLSLDRRQRAMLKEMGIHVWQPLPSVKPVPPVMPVAPVRPVAPCSPFSPAAPGQPAATALALPPNAIDSGASNAYKSTAEATLDAKNAPYQPASARAGGQAMPATADAWRIGTLQALYPDTANSQAPRWLVLLESPASALQPNYNPFEGDSGQLLDNLLRAAKLHDATALLAPLVRGQGAGGDLTADLASTFSGANANVVLVMGRLAAQALLQSTEPLAKLRGQVHTLHHTPTLITLEPDYLLRNPLGKAKAWDDLCLAMSLIAA